MPDRPPPNRTARPAFLAVSIMLLAGCAGPATEAPSELQQAEARAAAQALGKALKGELVAAMSEGGPSSALTVCNERAPTIAAAVSEQTGLMVGRTALRVRNPDNAPDDWERSQLERFAADIAGGADPAGLQAAAVVTEDGTRILRWMAPIMMEGACATCHGSAVPPALLDEIGALYPADEATGFEPGEMRGAFTVRQAIP